MQLASNTVFLLPAGFSLNQLIQGIHEARRKFRCSEGSHGAHRAVYLDSFDWRLFAQDKVLSFLPRGELLLQALDDDQPLFHVAQNNQPVWPVDIADSQLRAVVADPLDLRALMPQLELIWQWRQINVLNADEKTVVRLKLQTAQCREPGVSRILDLTPRVSIEPLKGYERQSEALQSVLQQLDLPLATETVYVEALDALSKAPGVYSSKIKVKLTAEQTTAEAVRQIFLDLLNTLEANIAGSKADIDSEFLHDLRVATRRTRSALSQVKQVLPETQLEDYKKRFAWVGSVTGPTRDLDVFLLELDNYRASLPTRMGASLQPLHDYLVEQQKSEQAGLKRKLNAPYFRQLIKDWRSYIESAAFPAADAEAPENALRPVAEVANERIWKMYRRVRKQGRAIDANSPAEALHDLRKSCKKLRYLIEFFQSLYPKKACKRLIKELKVLLDNLGDFQDLQVQAEKLQHFAAEMQQQDNAPLDTLMAMGALVADLLRHQEDAREAFAERFAAFDSEQNRLDYRQLFGAEKGA